MDFPWVVISGFLAMAGLRLWRADPMLVARIYSATSIIIRKHLLLIAPPILEAVRSHITAGLRDLNTN